MTSSPGYDILHIDIFPMVLESRGIAATVSYRCTMANTRLPSSVDRSVGQLCEPGPAQEFKRLPERVRHRHLPFEVFEVGDDHDVDFRR